MQKWACVRLLVFYDYTADDILVVAEAYSDSTQVLSNVGTEELHAYIRKLGDDGWELVNASMWQTNSKFREVYYFKRPQM